MGKDMNDENFRASEGYNSAFFKACYVMGSIQCAFSHYNGIVFEEVIFLFFFFQHKGGSLQQAYIHKLCTFPSLVTLQGSLSCLASHVECVLKFNVQFPLGCHCTHKDTLTRFTFTFYKSPESSLDFLWTGL